MDVIPAATVLLGMVTLSGIPYPARRMSRDMYSTACRRFCCISATRPWIVNDFCWVLKVANTAVIAMARITSAAMTSTREKPASG